MFIVKCKGSADESRFKQRSSCGCTNCSSSAKSKLENYKSLLVNGDLTGTCRCFLV